MPTAKLFGSLRREAGTSTVTVRGETVRQVLDALCADNAKLRAAIWDGERLHDHVRVVISGRDIELAQGLDTVVTSNDEIAIFSPIAGGADNL